MKQSACSGEPLTQALRHVEAGTPVAEGCRKLGTREQACDRWKRKCAGRGTAEWRRLRRLEGEDRELTPRVADLPLAKRRRQEVRRKPR